MHCKTLFTVFKFEVSVDLAIIRKGSTFQKEVKKGKNALLQTISTHFGVFSNNLHGEKLPTRRSTHIPFRNPIKESISKLCLQGDPCRHSTMTYSYEYHSETTLFSDFQNENKIVLLHFVAFFHVASLFSTGVDNKKVGVDNEKALELTNSTVFHRGRQ